ncbi:MAG: hypothetical protein JWO06_2089, partial [Bacteroidota bacterium]|nr:hypothetical protein [Bacteroidota bacterium]
MKKIIYLGTIALLISGIFSLSSCTKSLTAHYMFNDMNACLSASALGQHYQIVNFTINHNDLVTTVNQAGAKDVSRVQSANLSQMTATVASGSTFDQIGDIEVYYKTANTPNDSVM